ncbi:MAG: NADP-dependent oxidoreductase [Halobacteriales archaeon]
MDDVNRQYRLARRPSGRPDRDAFELVEEPVPEPGDDEVLVRTAYLSVDPYMRGRMRDRESYAEPWDVGQVLEGRVVGEVVASNHPDYEPGDLVVGMLHWADYAVAAGHRLEAVDTGPAPASTALGVLGTPGRTAYHGVFDVVEPRPGDTVVVSAAGGAVGSVAGQLAGLAGARVVGIAGRDEKLDFVVEACGFDAGINYREADVGSALADACPAGVDGYFDNVGGPITDAVVGQLAVGARVAVCGQIALYNDEGVPTGPRPFPQVLGRRARVEGFLVSDFDHRRQSVTDELAGWVADGTLAYRETVAEGLTSAPDAFLGLFDGANVGKQLVRVSTPA